MKVFDINAIKWVLFALGGYPRRNFRFVYQISEITKHYGKCNDFRVLIFPYWESLAFLIDLLGEKMQGRK